MVLSLVFHNLNQTKEIIKESNVFSRHRIFHMTNKSNLKIIIHLQDSYRQNPSFMEMKVKRCKQMRKARALRR